MKPLKYLVFGVLFGLMPSQLMAHPHAWITMNATLQFNDDGKIVGIYEEWRFDTNYSEAAIDGMDANKDGFYDPGELDPLTRENIKALKDYGYFSVVKENNKKVAFGEVTEYGQYFSNKQLTMNFTIPLKKPLDPRGSKFELKIFDPSFYIAMDFQKKNPVGASGAMPKDCKIVLKPIPSDEEIDKKKQMLAAKPKEWQASPEEEFGALFAQPVVVDCSLEKSS